MRGISMAGNDEVSATSDPLPPGQTSLRAKTPQAKRALDEAQARRIAAAAAHNDAPREVNGREGPDPIRYGDWENKGIASDF